MALSLSKVRRLAAREGWVEVQHDVQSAVVGFKRGEDRVNVYWTTGTVGTCVDHPRAGKTQLFRRGRTLAHLSLIFKNPRVHSGVGYYRRHSSQRPEPSQRGLQQSLYCLLSSRRMQKVLLSGWSEDSEMLALGSGYFVVDRHGGSWWDAVPTQLHNKVNSRQKSLPPVDYVALGEGGSFFVQFADGDWRAQGPDSLYEALNAADCNVEVLAFAPDGGWYVLWEDGCYAWEGLPRGLYNQLNVRQKSLPGVEELACGPNGEWFVRFLDGSWRARGMSQECEDAMDNLRQQGCDVCSVKFGEDWTWAIQYSY